MDAGQDEVGRNVVVLGAGFSRALSAAMPLTDELGNLCLEDTSLRSDLRVPNGGFTGGRFETWLSQLADDQPYLTAAENLENQALFLRFSAAIAEKLGGRVNDVLSEDWRHWFPEFLRLCHYSRSTLLTFNYDPLVECGVGTGILCDIGRSEPVSWTEVIGDVPSWAPGAMRLAAERAITFRLLKLHGSLNWYWSPGDTAGVSMARRDLPGVYGAPVAYDEEERQRELPGRAPFVVPPSATKSAYYQNPVVREIWGQAAAALRDATSVAFIGYSLPSSDLTFAGMLADSLRDSSVPITIVDLAPAGVRERLMSLGISADQIREIPPQGHSPVAEFVGSWRDTAACQIWDVLSAHYADQLDDPLLVFWNNDATGVVIKLLDDDRDIVLFVERWTRLGLANQGRSDSDPPLVTLRELLCAAGDNRHLTIETVGGHRQAIIAAARWKTGIGAGRGVWTALVPSGLAPTA